MAANVEKQSKYYRGSSRKNIVVGDPVWVRKYTKPTFPTWEKCKVIGKKSNVMYEITTEDGKQLVRHADQIRGSPPDKRKSSIATPLENNEVTNASQSVSTNTSKNK